jgi:hypothetical protein
MVLQSSLQLVLLQHIAEKNETAPINASHNGAVLAVFDRVVLYLLQPLEDTIFAYSQDPEGPINIDDDDLNVIRDIESSGKLDYILGVMFGDWLFPREIDNPCDFVQNGELQHKQTLKWVADYVHFRQAASSAAPVGLEETDIQKFQSDVLYLLETRAQALVEPIYAQLQADYDWAARVCDILDSYELNP